jgi:hypothetical protein
LVLEDDVVPAKGWAKRLARTIEEIEAQYGQEYVLSLYAASPHLPKSVAADNYYLRYPPPFYGTQAMYYPEPIRLAFAEHLQNEGVESFRTHYDGILRMYLKMTGIPLFVTMPILFQHIGKLSTGCSKEFHHAKSFSGP